MSKKNEHFLKELRTKDFYSAYKQQNDELTKLRDAHALLIKMIHSKDISVRKQTTLTRSHASSVSLGGLLSGKFDSKKAIKRLTTNSIPPIKRLLSCGTNGNLATVRDNNNEIIENEPFETMESLKVAEIDDYLEAVLNKCKGSQSVGINFMESPRSSQL